jgi:pimeloyl-ACP methyl ester carboxylesterase
VQATTGFGGTAGQYSATTTNYYGLGAGAYTLVLPVGAGTAKLPVVYLIHGYGTLDVTPYGSWAEHLAMRGAIVIYPQYQLLSATGVSAYTPNAVQAIKDALARIASAGGVQADTSKVIVIGHSLGGAVAANVAAIAGSSGIPQPIAMMTVNPSNESQGGTFVMAMEDLAQIPATTLQLSLFSDADQRITDKLAKQIFYGTTNVTAANKDYIVVNSDDYGDTALVADHFAALAGRTGIGALYPPDGLDYYAYWKLSDALMAAAFNGDVAGRDTALGHGSVAQRYMGKWGDGMAVKLLTVTDAP